MTMPVAPAQGAALSAPTQSEAPPVREHKLYFFTPLPVRLWHWLNALAILTLIATGVQLRFPDKVHLLTYKHVVSLHNWAGIAVCALFFFWGAYYGIVNRHFFRLFQLYVPTKAEIWPGILRQAIFYLWGYFRGEPHPYKVTPDNKFNPMQKLFYAILMFFVVPLLCASGLVMLNLTPLREWLSVVGGIKLVVSIHYLAGAFVGMFLFIHLYLSTMGRTLLSGFRTMFTGWGEIEDD